MNVKLNGHHRVLLSKPAETVLLYESSVLRRSGSGIGATIADRHDDGAIYLYVDGHTKWLGKNEKPSFDVALPKMTKGIGKAVSRNRRKK